MEFMNPGYYYSEGYMDDLAQICTEVKYEKALSHFLSIIEEQGITMNLKKCTFATTSFHYLGHKISEHIKYKGITM